MTYTTLGALVEHTRLGILYEGIPRPQSLSLIHDGGARDGEDIAVLERYFIDIQNLFLRRLSSFSSDGDVSEDGQDGMRLRSLLDELIKVKMIIVNSQGQVGDIT